MGHIKAKATCCPSLNWPRIYVNMGPILPLHRAGLSRRELRMDDVRTMLVAMSNLRNYFLIAGISALIP